MINGNEGEVCVCVRDREKEKKKEDDVDDEWLWLEVLLQIREVAVMKHFTSNSGLKADCCSYSINMV